jgi:hypothetical protein
MVSFNDLKGWYALPYIEEPEKDKDFATYFTNKWMESLKITTHNFLSLVLHTAPLPKLLLVDRWFRSEAQQELRSQLDLSANKINTLISKLEENEKRLCNLHEAINLLVTHVQKATVSSSTTTQRTSSIGLFETDEVAENKKIKVILFLLSIVIILIIIIIILIIIIISLSYHYHIILILMIIKLRELGQNVCKLANTITTKMMSRNSLPTKLKLRKIIGKMNSSLFYGDDLQDNSNIPSIESLHENENNTNETNEALI